MDSKTVATKKDLKTLETRINKDLQEFAANILAGIEGMFKEQDKRIDRVADDVAVLKSDITDTKKKLGKIEKKVDRLQDDMSDLKTDMKLVKRTTVTNDTRLTSLEAAIE